jgi:hypothetical protein
MTTATWSSRVRHDSDAVYWEWRDEFITKLGVLVAGGFLAADETTVVAGAGARPGANTEQSYAVYHLSDSLHGTAPVYIRFGFGTMNGTQTPRIQMTTGTSTNGAGVLGGTCLSAITHCQNQSQTNATADTVRNSYFCAVAGFLGISWKQGSSGEGFFFVNRTCDSTGAISATGSLVGWGAGSISGMTKTQAFRYASTAIAYTAATSVNDTALGMNPQGVTSTLVGSTIQVGLGWTITPAVAPLFGVCGVLNSEVGAGTTFSVALVGSSARTYIGLTTISGTFSASAMSNANALKYAMLWE